MIGGGALMSLRFAIFLATVLVVATAKTAPAAEPGPAKYDRYFNQIKPLLQAKCIGCHGPDKQKGGLRLDSQVALLKGGDSGPAIVAGEPEKSLLIQAVRHAHKDVQMPPKEKLKDDQLAALAAWVKDGAVMPAPAMVLFEGEEEIIPALKEGNGTIRLTKSDRLRGSAALLIAPQRSAPAIAAWNFKIREKPAADEYRFIRFSWKKRGGGAIMLEVANAGKWRTEKETHGAWVAGKNTTGWAAHVIADTTPAEWATVTRDLWKDGGAWGDFTLTGLCLTAIDGGEALFDSVLLGSTIESIDAYQPGRGKLAFNSTQKPGQKIGDAWTDPNNPIVSIFKGQRLDLWSLKKPARPELPSVKNTAWSRTPIDRFILAKLEAKGLAPSPEADRRTLIRRLYFDLIGLPPAPADVEAFINDKSADAYEKLVEKLLASKHYGERWARRWLDVVRYSDSNGFERDEFRPEAWRYRDYVIRSFNQDKPYDQFVREQLAGDEMPSPGSDAIIATGYLRLGPYDSTRSIFQEDKKGHDELMADLVNTTGSAFLGMTLACCQCHDHKYDPISQADHYRLRAFFAAVKFRDDFEIDSSAERERLTAHNSALDQQIAPIQRDLNAILAAAKARIADERRAKFPAEILELLKIDEAKRDEETKKKLKPFVDQLNVSDKDAAAGLKDDAKKHHSELMKKLAELNGKKIPSGKAMAMSDAAANAPATHIFFQGDFTQPRDQVAPGFFSILNPNPATIAKPAGNTTGRRTALANWIVSPDNPLTSRVLVNRLWQHHFGKGIVATPNDFGFSGARPTHPELLHWLATEFMNGTGEPGALGEATGVRGTPWSIKHLHRLMVLSATYRQASVEDAKRKVLDPENALLWRQNVQRLEAETLRDALLSVSGLLLPSDSGKPLWPPVPDDILKAQPAILEAVKGGPEFRLQNWFADPLEKTDVRSVFLVQKRSVPLPFLQPFDFPDTTCSCAKRNVTTVAPQALTLMNSPFAVRAARAFADRVSKDAGADPAERVEKALWLTLGRGPSDDERKIALDLLKRHTDLHAKRKKEGGDAPEHQALIDLCRAFLNLNEFSYID
jgi:mono/diheme cytochrome c family protein